MHRRLLLPREDDQEDVEALERSIRARYARQISPCEGGLQGYAQFIFKQRNAGDLAKVVDVVDTVRQRVTVKLIPQIDLQALSNKLDGREVPQKKAFVPPPCFMNVDEARA
ncbi:hypothetical protein F0562_031787 [Nyssa sinensis]|uniref:Spt5 KOW domain-containing protein n=1 Tax=Nyssa sinensis TaxID=561372 RepID=A0A5J5AVF9_9ASTE|nr:hypothetical protein F0562_031787 [Nyssa sinensis]